jgi:hypothetical protein
MPSPLNTISLKAFRIGVFLIVLAALALTFYLTDLYLRTNFVYYGEAYMKGAGHLLQEDFWKAILFLTTRHLLLSSCCFFLIFGMMGRESRRGFYRTFRYVVFAILAILSAYIIYQVWNVFTAAYDREERMIEIALTWILRVTGFFIGYKLADTAFRRSLRKKHVSQEQLPKVE